MREIADYFQGPKSQFKFCLLLHPSKNPVHLLGHIPISSVAVSPTKSHIHCGQRPNLLQWLVQGIALEFWQWKLQLLTPTLLPKTSGQKGPRQDGSVASLVYLEEAAAGGSWR